MVLQIEESKYFSFCFAQITLRSNGNWTYEDALEGPYFPYLERHRTHQHLRRIIRYGYGHAHVHQVHVHEQASAPAYPVLASHPGKRPGTLSQPTLTPRMKVDDPRYGPYTASYAVRTALLGAGLADTDMVFEIEGTHRQCQLDPDQEQFPLPFLTGLLHLQDQA